MFNGSDYNRETIWFFSEPYLQQDTLRNLLVGPYTDVLIPQTATHIQLCWEDKLTAIVLFP